MSNCNQLRIHLICQEYVRKCFNNFGSDDKLTYVPNKIHIANLLAVSTFRNIIHKNIKNKRAKGKHSSFGIHQSFSNHYHRSRA